MDLSCCLPCVVSCTDRSTCMQTDSHCFLRSKTRTWSIYRFQVWHVSQKCTRTVSSGAAFLFGFGESSRALLAAAAFTFILAGPAQSEYSINRRHTPEGTNRLPAWNRRWSRILGVPARDVDLQAWGMILTNATQTWRGVPLARQWGQHRSNTPEVHGDLSHSELILLTVGSCYTPRLAFLTRIAGCFGRRRSFHGMQSVLDQTKCNCKTT